MFHDLVSFFISLQFPIIIEILHSKRLRTTLGHKNLHNIDKGVKTLMYKGISLAKNIPVSNGILVALRRFQVAKIFA